MNQLPSWVSESDKEHDEITESTSGPFGGLSCTTFAIGSCLSFQVDGWMDGWQQTVVCDHITRDRHRNPCIASSYSFSEEYYLFHLSPFGLFVLFLFSFVFALHLFSRHFLVLYHKKTATLYLLIAIQAPACTQAYLHPWFPISVLYASFSSLLHTKICSAAFHVSVSTMHWALPLGKLFLFWISAFQLVNTSLLESLYFTEGFCLVRSWSYMLIFWWISKQ